MLRQSSLAKVRPGNSLWWGIAGVVYYCWFQAFYNAMHYGEIWPYYSAGNFGMGIICNLLPVMTIWWTSIGIVYYWIPFRSKWAKITGDIFAAMAVAVMVNWIFAIVFKTITGSESHIDWSGTLLNDILVLILVEMTFYYRGLMLAQKEVETMQQQITRYKYESLKAQVNPHFLFNSFNLLYSLIIIDGERAREFVKNLAEMYRYILVRHNRNRVSAKEEILFINSYISVLTTRFHNKFSVNWTGLSSESKILDKYGMVPFTLQMLVENVVKHNVVSSHTPMNIEINISEEGITVINPLQPKEESSEKSSSSFGLRYLRDAYSAANRDFIVTNDREHGFFRVYAEWLPEEQVCHNDQIS